MDNQNKLIRLDFSRYLLQEIGGFTTDILIAILKALPEGTRVRSFSERHFDDSYSILLSHNSFTETPTGSIIPVVTATITEEYTKYNVGLTWPKEYTPEKKFEAYLKSIKVKE